MVASRSDATTTTATRGHPSAARSGRLSYSIFLLSRAQRACADRLLEQFGLQAGNEHLMMSIYERDGQRRTELLEVLGLDDPTIAKAVTCLERDGLVQLEEPSASCPVHLVWLTDEGRALQRPLEEALAPLHATTLAVLREEVEAFVAIAQTIEAALELR